jgi:hypothetical protein
MATARAAARKVASKQRWANRSSGRSPGEPVVRRAIVTSRIRTLSSVTSSAVRRRCGWTCCRNIPGRSTLRPDRSDSSTIAGVGSGTSTASAPAVKAVGW